MGKHLLRSILAVVLVTGSAVVGGAPTGSAKGAPAVRKSAVTDSLYAITTTKQTATPPGCVGTTCPQVETDVPALVPAEGFASLVGAKKIDTYSTSTGPNQTEKGGCAISAAGTLLCWGANSKGQLGNGTVVDSLITPVSAAGLSGNVTDVTTNGFTTCVVTDAGAVKCVGQGSWPGFSRQEVSGNVSINTRTWNGSSFTDTWASSNTSTCKILNGATVVGETANCWSQSSNFSLAWVELFASGVKKVQIASSQGWDNANICVLRTDNTVACSKVVPGSRGSSTSNNATEYDCNNDGIYESASFCQQQATHKRRDNNNTLTPWSAATWTWVDSGYTDVTDFAMSDQAWGSDGTMCFIQGTDKSVSCKSFKGVVSTGDPNQAISTSGGTWGTAKPIEGVYQAEKVFITTFNGIGLCAWASGTLYCGNGAWDGSTVKFPTSVSSVGVMAKPSAIFAVSGPSGKVYFVTEAGILAADQWVFNCSNCPKQSGAVLSAVSSFKNATTTSFFSIAKMTGSTDSPDLIPMQIETGTRKMLSQKSITVKSSSGSVLVGTSVRWTAPDIPDSLGSSMKSTSTTDSTGSVRLASVATGPVAFTLRGGTLPDGSYLQAAVVITNVPDSGTVEVVVPNPAPVVERSVEVRLTDGTPVPNAVVQLANNYLSYSYVNDGARNASWSATPPDNRGYMRSADCAYCYVPPPTYITGANGKVTWKSFNPGTRSSQVDATVIYDDGSLQQKKKANLDSTSQVVTLDFMANIQTELPAEIKTKSDGSASLPVSLKDGDQKPISNLEMKVEEVCGEMQAGGLWTGTSSVQEGYCGGNAPQQSTSPGTSSSQVQSSGVHASACNSKTYTTTNSSGSATLQICPSKSAFYRVRASGVLPSKSICVVVAGKPCSVTMQNSYQGQSTSGGSTSSKPSVPKSMKRNTGIDVGAFYANFTPKKGAGTYKAYPSGSCRMSGRTVVATSKKGTCTVKVIQKNKGKVKGATKTFKVKVT